MLYLILAALGILTIKSLTAPTGGMSPAQRLTYEGLLSADSPPTSAQDFLKYATAFDAQGLRYEAQILRKRARIASLPPAARQQIKSAFQTGLASKDPTAIRVLANTMESEGFFGNAEALRDVANSLETGLAILAAQRQEMVSPTRPAGSNVSTGGGTASVIDGGSYPSAAAVIASATPEQIAAAKKALGIPDSPSASSSTAGSGGSAAHIVASATEAELAKARAAVAADLSSIPSNIPSAGPSAVPAGPPPASGSSSAKPSLADFDRMAAAEAASPGSSRSM